MINFSGSKRGCGKALILWSRFTPTGDGGVDLLVEVFFKALFPRIRISLGVGCTDEIFDLKGHRESVFTCWWPPALADH
jgi:hypothetical protein